MQKRWQFVSRQEEKAASATGVEVGDAYTLKKCLLLFLSRSLMLVNVCSKLKC